MHFKNPNHEEEGTAWRDQIRGHTVSGHRSEEGYGDTSALLKIPKSTLVFVILKGKKLKTTRSHLMGESSKEKQFAKRCDRGPKGHSHQVPEVLCVEEENFQGKQVEKLLKDCETMRERERSSGLMKPRLNSLASVLTVVSQTGQG